MKMVNLHAAKTQLSRLVDEVAQGKEEEILIAKSGKPVARLVPLRTAPASRRPGGWKGKMWIAEDFDAPLPEAMLGTLRDGESS